MGRMGGKRGVKIFVYSTIHSRLDEPMRRDSSGFHGNGETMLPMKLLERMQILLVRRLHLVRARGAARVGKTHTDVDRSPFHLIRDPIVSAHPLN